MRVAVILAAMAVAAVLIASPAAAAATQPAAAATPAATAATAATALPAAAAAERGAATPPLLVQRGDRAAPQRGPWARTLAWIRGQQQRFYRSLAGAIRDVKEHRSLAAAWGLVVLSFLYGVFHAAGPGHGKAVISAYLVADEVLVRRGIALAFAAALVQALSAIVLVGVLVLALSAAGRTATAVAVHLEAASYALVMVVGLYMLWRAVRGLVRVPMVAHAGHPHAHDGCHSASCGHAHMPGPEELKGEWSLKRAAAIALAVGVRPCAGAVLVLIFANSLGLFAAGVGATFAMALGTALTVSAIAVLTLCSKRLATGLAGSSAAWLTRLQAGLGIAGALFVFAIGLVLLAGALGADRPLV